MSKSDTINHLQLLADVGDELAGLVGSTDVRSFLQQTARRIAKHLHTAVCSIYIYEEPASTLVLQATVGLKPEKVGTLTLQLSEGLVGKAMRELRPIVTSEASKHPDYLYVPDAGEEAFDCFLAAPILRGVERVGVLTLQREAPQTFSEEEIAVVRAFASQLAGAVGHAKAILGLQEAAPDTPDSAPCPPLIRGRGASAGCALGRAFVYHSKATLSQAMNTRPGSGSIASVTAAFDRTITQLVDMQARLRQRLPEATAAIFEAHVMMLQDQGFRARVFAKLGEGLSDVGAVAAVARHYMDRFDANPHDYMKEKARDIEDLALRIIDQLHAVEGSEARGLAERIIIARELLPSDMLTLATENVAGVILVCGGLTSHVAILARSLQIPAVIVESPELMRIEDGTLVGLDGNTGNVYVDPSETARAQLVQRVHMESSIDRDAIATAPETRSKDGSRVWLMANINMLGELKLAEQLHAEGVGLYRTEFPFLIRNTLPTCEEQEAIYRHLFERMQGREVTIRTLDAGGDKMLSYFDTAGEANPELGLRSTRFTLRHPDIFDDQLRAMLRAWDSSSILRIMFPMISSPDEFTAARQRLTACMEKEGIDPAGNIRVGMMLELPAVVEMMNEFVELADFFSVGTNDFVQYMLAADRTNERVAEYYCPHHPSVLRALERVISCALAAHKDISICGEMAHDPRYVPFFMGVGIRKLSIDPHWLPSVQQTIQSQTMADMEAYAKALLAARSVLATHTLLRAP